MDDFYNLIGAGFTGLFKGIWFLIKKTAIFFWHHPKIFFLTVGLIFAAVYQFLQLSGRGSLLGENSNDIIQVKDLLKGNYFMPGLRMDGTDYFTGPVFYYLIAPFLYIADFQPSGLVIMVELYNFLTVIIIFLFGKRIFHKEAGLFAAIIYSISAFLVSIAKQTALPVLLIFYVVLTLWMLFNAIGSAKPAKYFLLSGFLFAICFQLNSFAVFLFPVLVLFVFLGEWMMLDSIRVLYLLRQYLLICVGFAVGIIPFVLADAKFKFVYTSRMLHATYGNLFPTLLHNITKFDNTLLLSSYKIFMQAAFNLPDPLKLSTQQAGTLIFWQIFALLILVIGLVLLVHYRNKFVLLLFGLYLVMGLLFVAAYKTTNDFYLSYFYPIPIMIVGFALGSLFRLFDQDPDQVENRPVANPNAGADGDSYGEEYYEVVHVKRYDKKKLALHIICILGSLFLFSCIFYFNLLVKSP